jgi:hypothetical protein
MPARFNWGRSLGKYSSSATQICYCTHPALMIWYLRDIQSKVEEINERVSAIDFRKIEKIEKQVEEIYLAVHSIDAERCHNRKIC